MSSCNTTGGHGCNGCDHQEEHAPTVKLAEHLGTLVRLGYLRADEADKRLRRAQFRANIEVGGKVVHIASGRTLRDSEIEARERFSFGDGIKIQRILANGGGLRLAKERPSFDAFPSQGIQLPGVK